MFKLPHVPSPKANISELSDYMELRCWVDGRISRTDMIRFLSAVDDNLDEDGEEYTGCEAAEEKNERLLDEAMLEIEYREHSCNGGYPFGLDQTGTILKLRRNTEGSCAATIYFYLLAATRLNMKTDKKQANIDGTLEMEKVSAHALSSYLGNRSKTRIFGTSSRATFKNGIDSLCRELKEPAHFSNVDGDNALSTPRMINLILSPGCLLPIHQANLLFLPSPRQEPIGGIKHRN